MRHTIVLLFLLFFCKITFSQKKYFQQQVKYKIDVTLNDRSHILHAHETIDYKNNSSDTLKFLYFHLWPNAYKNDQSAMTAHMVENRKTKFYYSKESERGFIDSLQFTVDGVPVNTSEVNAMQDVVMIELLQPLLPGGTIQIATPFRVVLPSVFSRMGFASETYHITQWYPKPAVYDRDGWHAMPYLDQGEFYSEFGSFEVNITLPENYVVAATGDLQNEEEKKFLTSRELKNNSALADSLKNVISSEKYKTIQYKQYDVHDFAWFASKYFLLEKKVDTLHNGHIFVAYSFFTPALKNIYNGSAHIAAQTVKYLSQKVGPYPYNQVSVVSGVLLAGGGMEYPNVTVIGSVGSASTLQTVIVHEVGHNWFYGMLGSNERIHPWMDEGINSYYEKRIENFLNAGKQNEKGNAKFSSDNLQKQIYPVLYSERKDLPASAPAADYTPLGLGGIVYEKNAMLFAMLESYLGTPLMDSCMQQYFKIWSMKHPTPNDIREIFEQVSKRDLNWFFDMALNTTEPIDFAIKKVNKSEGNYLVYAISKTKYNGPIPLSAFVGKEIKATKWIEYPYITPAIFSDTLKTERWEINPNFLMPEVKLNNNIYNRKGLFHKYKHRFLPLSNVGINNYHETYLLPLVGYNVYDGTMLGLAIHNIRIPNHQFQYLLAPMYSFQSASVVGTGIMGYHFFADRLNKITVSLQGNRFHHGKSTLNINKPIFLLHHKIAPAITWEHRNKSVRKPVLQELQLKYYYISEQHFKYEKSNIDSLYRPTIGNNTNNHFYKISYIYKNNRTFNPYRINATLFGGAYFAKLNIETNLRIDYHLPKKSFYARLYAGRFFYINTDNKMHNLRNAFLNTTPSGNNDIVYDETYIGRNEQNGIGAKQVSASEGNFKMRTPMLASPVGQSDQWLFAANFKTDIPAKLPLKLQLFLDLATVKNSTINTINNDGKLLYNGGLQLSFFNETFIIYAPLLLSKDFKQYRDSFYPKYKYFRSITFALNTQKLNFLKTNKVIDMLNF